MKIEDFRPIRSQDSAPIKFDWLLTQESDWIIWTNQKITLIIFWLVKNGKDWNPAIPLVKRIFLVPDHIWPKTIKGQPALTHVIRNYVLLLVVPPLCLWWVTHIVTKALRLKILPGQQLPLFPNPPTLLIHVYVMSSMRCSGFPQGLENLEKYIFLEKSWKVMELWKIIKSHWKVIELRKSHTYKSSPSVRNLALISFASRLVSCIYSNTSDYKLLGEFKANPLVYCYWFLAATKQL